MNKQPLPYPCLLCSTASFRRAADRDSHMDAIHLNPPELTPEQQAAVDQFDAAGREYLAKHRPRPE